MTGRSVSVLWIGRMIFSPVVRIREPELLDHVAGHARVFALDRSDAPDWGREGLKAKLRLRYTLAATPWTTFDAGTHTRFRMPLAMATDPILGPLAAVINERNVRRALERFGCDVVFHSSPTFFMPDRPGRRSYRYHFDLVDNFFDGYPDTPTGRWRRGFLRELMLRADSLSTISHRLCDRVEEFTGRRPAYIPNGVDLDRLRAWPAARAEAVRQRHGLIGRRVLVYVGNHMASFDGMEMLMDAFTAARRERPELELVIVGPGGARVPAARGLGAGEGVHVVGPVPAAEVWDYFRAADLGLLPFVIEPGTHDCLPLKVLEFGGAGRPMLATPLAELERLALPHVRFAPYDSEAWKQALLDESTYAPPGAAALEQAMRPFTWAQAADDLMKAMGLRS
jgi:glycosyltransferase involved in cell wall biosynthesis